MQEQEDGAGVTAATLSEPLPLTVPEVRHLLFVLGWQLPPDTEHVLHWSGWRRRHQVRATQAHIKHRQRRL